MKLNKICLFALSPIFVGVPALSSSCSLFADSASKKIYTEGEFVIEQKNNFFIEDTPTKFMKDIDLVLEFKNTAKINDKLIHKDLEPSNIFIRYKTGESKYSDLISIEKNCTVVNNTVTIKKEFINEILDKAKKQLKYNPEIHFYIRDCQISDELSWKDIGSFIQTTPYVTNSFSVGDTKTLKINNLDHKVRIVDFSKYSGAKVVFEFVDVISDADGNPVTSFWDKKVVDAESGKLYFNYKYNTSTLVDTLNTNILPLIKTALGDAQSYLKTITKIVGTCDKDPSEFDTKRSVADYQSNKTISASIFVPTLTNIIATPKLSDEELVYYTKLDGSLFAYYENSTSSTIKHSVNGSSAKYWTDTPDVNNYNKAWTINKEGQYSSEVIYVDGEAEATAQYKKTIAPCFCF